MADKTIDASEAMRLHLEELLDAARRLGLSPKDMAVAVERAWEGAGNATAVTESRR